MVLPTSRPGSAAYTCPCACPHTPNLPEDDDIEAAYSYGLCSYGPEDDDIDEDDDIEAAYSYGLCSYGPEDS